jgi:hypothetical protein
MMRKLAGIVAGLLLDLAAVPGGDGRAGNHAGGQPDAVVGESAGEGTMPGSVFLDRRPSRGGVE